jgi:hypothetical protein
MIGEGWTYVVVKISLLKSITVQWQYVLCVYELREEEGGGG